MNEEIRSAEPSSAVPPVADRQSAATALRDAKRLWLVTGTTGEYSDRSEWAVAVLPSEEAARAFVETLERLQRELAVEHGLGGPEYALWQQEQAFEEAMRAFDPGYHRDYTGTRWFCGAVPVLGEGSR